MKKLLVCLLCLIMMLAFVACGINGNGGNTGDNGNGGNTGDNGDNGNGDDGNEDPFEGLAVMTYEEYAAAELDSPVYIEAYVQGHQSWWSDKITVYLADEDGAYFVYELACSAEDAAKLTVGTKIAVKGYKAAWSGEVEIIDATFEFVEDADTYVAEAIDLTDLLGTDDLIDYQNQFVSFTGLTVESISFKNDGDDDIYVNLVKDGQKYSFCVEVYLTGTSTEVYQAVSALKPGDIINLEGFLYWYEGPNTHITSVSKVGVLSYEEYVAAELDQFVVIEAYVQGHQSWWSDKITVYLADEDGAYFVYELACSAEDAAKLTTGTKIRVYGYKAEWSGEIELIDATFEFVEGADTYVAEPKDVTAYLGTDELVNYQNQLVTFSGLTVKGISFKNDGGDDIYVSLEYNGVTYSFCVEVYLTGTSTENYQAVSALKEGDVVDVTGFLYWYEGPNTHITKVVVK